MYQRGFDTLRLTTDDDVAVITMNRPRALNALTPEMVDELYEAFTFVGEDDSVRAVVLTGEGRGFSAGGDIFEDAAVVAEMSPWDYRHNVERYARPILAIAQLDRPVIAAINGVAVGGGWDLALACDIRIASTDARFKDSYVQLGVVPELGGSYYLPRFAGMGRAKLISLTGQFVSADEALKSHLVEEVVEPSQLLPRCLELARQIGSAPADRLARIKYTMGRFEQLGLEESIVELAGLRAAASGRSESIG